MKRRTLDWYKEATIKSDIWRTRIKRAESFKKNHK